jgi:hypothetical protein
METAGSITIGAGRRTNSLRKISKTLFISLNINIEMSKVSALHWRGFTGLAGFK